jgi:hypothetical protein
MFKALQPMLNYEHQKVFSQWLLQWDVVSPTFLSQVLLMGEVCFTWNGILNTTSIHGLIKTSFLSRNTIPTAVCNKCLGRNNW